MKKMKAAPHQPTDPRDAARVAHSSLTQKSHISYTDVVFESMSEGVIATNQSGKITRANAAALSMLGYTKKQVIGKPFYEVLIAIDQNGQESSLAHRPHQLAIQQAEAVSSRLHYRTARGDIIAVSVNVAPIVDHGIIHGTVQIFRDISNEVEFDRLQSEFISLASHQLRTPLTAISTYGHMLLSGFKGPLNEGQTEFMETILTSADRMSNLINTLLNVSRLSSGDLSTEISKINVTRLISTTKQELWPLAKTKSQFLITKAPDADVFLTSDQLLLTEICGNLISNAIKYTPEEGTVTIELSKSETGIILTVTDTGYGIPAHLQPRIFSKFFRAPNILHAEAVGTGLGLFLVKEIVQRLGGNISFTSTENKGSAFTVRLPDMPEGATTPTN